MAFGMQLAGSWGKVVLTVFRFIAITGIGVLLYLLIRKKRRPGLIMSMSLIFAGAVGNLIDSLFYGLIFSSSTFYSPAKLVPFGHGYAGCYLFGPEGHFIFFRPIFNIADASITIGVFWLLLFHRKNFKL